MSSATAEIRRIVRKRAAAFIISRGYVRAGIGDALPILTAPLRLGGRTRTDRSTDDIATLAVQGGPGSWSEESLLDTLPGARVLRCRTVAAAWRAVLDGRAHGAWLPARNSTLGDLSSTSGVRAEAACLAERAYPVRHALLAPRGSRMRDVARVIGHPYALAQCERTLARLLPDAKRVGDVDGAHAARRLARGSAVLASARVAPRWDLRVLRSSVVDDPGNTTTFLLLVPKAAWGVHPQRRGPEERIVSQRTSDDPYRSTPAER